MLPRSLPLLVLAGMLSSCSLDGIPPVDAPASLTEPGVTFALSGTLKGPKGLLSTREVTRQVVPFVEEALPGVSVHLADARLQPLPDTGMATTGADGSFALASPHRAGFLMARTASGSAPLMAFYRDGHAAAMSVASTMVSWKLAADMVASPSVVITRLDPVKIQAATELVNKELVNRSLTPDLSLASWPQALDFYTYQRQGELAQAFNAIIPGSVAPKMSR